MAFDCVTWNVTVLLRSCYCVHCCTEYYWPQTDVADAVFTRMMLAIAGISCHRVCPSVHPSVTSRCSTEMAKHKHKQHYCTFLIPKILLKLKQTR